MMVSISIHVHIKKIQILTKNRLKKSKFVNIKRKVKIIYDLKR